MHNLTLAAAARCYAIWLAATARIRCAALRSDYLRVAWRNRATEFDFFSLVRGLAARVLAKLAGMWHEPSSHAKMRYMRTIVCAYEKRKASASN